MTLNQIIKRIREISLAHNQLREFYFGVPTDFLTKKTTRYAGAFLQDTSGSIDPVGNIVNVGFKLFLLDLVHVATESKDNELDVQSDMMSIAMDLIAEMNHSSYFDWKISASNPLVILREQLNDLVAGVVVDFTVSFPWGSSLCEVPTDSLPGVITIYTEKPVFDLKYVTDGTEASTLAPPEVVGKKILLIIRENNPIFKVSINPDPAEFTWDNISIGLGTPVMAAGERFLILYRDY